MGVKGLQTAVSLVYPPRCLGCGETVERDFGLCGACWSDTRFIGGSVCDGCGTPLMGDVGGAVRCDGCTAAPPPWIQGRSALVYAGNGRRMVLGLKHGDRQEIAKPAAHWMAQALGEIVRENALVAPVPLHWMRLLKRRYNQSALLAKALAAELDLPWCPDLLQRLRRTASLDGLDREARRDMLAGAIVAHPNRRHRMIGRPVLLVDDVLTSGATLGACAQACLDAGSGSIQVVTLARAVKEA